MAAQFSYAIGNEKGAIALGTASMTTTDVRVQIKTGTTREQALLGLERLKQRIMEDDTWAGT